MSENMDFEKDKISEKSKLFVGGISRETSEDALRDHFSKYGVVSGSIVAKDRNTRSPRGFGFVWFSDPSIADQALQDTHVILGRKVEVKKAIPKSEHHLYQRQQQQHDRPNQQRNGGLSMNSSNGNSDDCFRTKKIFVGGLSASLTEEQFKDYFERFGRIIDVVVMHDSSTNRPRGFGFVTFDSEESVDRVLLNTFHKVNGRFVEVKRAVPKDRINSSNSTHVTRNSVRGSSNKSPPPGNYPFYGHGYEGPGYSPLLVYNGVGGYLYGADVYGGGHPMVGYGRPGFEVMPIASGGLWSGPVMIGPGPIPCSSTYFYPSYMNGGGGHMGTMVSGHSAIDRPGVNGKLGVFSSNEHPSPDAIPPLIE